MLTLARLLTAATGEASDETLRGHVREAITSLPTPCATIAIQNTESGAVADINGNFTLRIPRQPTTGLRISSVGYLPLYTTLTHDEVHAQSTFAFELEPRIIDAGIEPSVDSAGDSYGNALAESVIGLYKTEVIYRRGPWKNLEVVEISTLEWADWFNNRKSMETVGNFPPAEFEDVY